MTGTVCSLRLDRGFGFVKLNGTGEELFFHANSVVDLPFDGRLEQMEVQFELEHEPHRPRPRAINVRAR